MPSWANSLAALLIALAAPAAATPPQIVNVEDRLFARNADTLLLLREITDNHGNHFVLQTDTLLVFRSLTDGADRGFRGVERVLEYRFIEDVERVTYLPLENPANPYAVRAEGGFWPLAPARFTRAEATLDEAGLRVTEDSETRYHLPLTRLSDHIADTLRAGRGILPRYTHMQPPDLPDAFMPDIFDPVRDCVADNVTQLFETDSDPVLVHLTCEDHDYGQQALLWIVVPRVTE